MDLARFLRQWMINAHKQVHNKKKNQWRTLLFLLLLTWYNRPADLQKSHEKVFFFNARVWTLIWGAPEVHQTSTFWMRPPCFFVFRFCKEITLFWLRKWQSVHNVAAIAMCDQRPLVDKGCSCSRRRIQEHWFIFPDRLVSTGDA